jgi:hypothetical protein
MPTESADIDLLKRTCASLAESNLKLHKIASNSVAVMRAFEPEELASGIRDLGLDDETLPVQRSLDSCWDINTDMFTFKVAVTDKPYTRRGVPSIVNSVFDPLGLAAPVTIRGRLLLQELSRGVQDWDAPLPVKKVSTWEKWKSSLEELSSLHVPRCYVPMSLSKPMYTELCLFSDASNWAIGAVAYLRAVTKEGCCEVGFVMGKAKLSRSPSPQSHASSFVGPSWLLSWRSIFWMNWTTSQTLLSSTATAKWSSDTSSMTQSASLYTYTIVCIAYTRQHLLSSGITCPQNRIQLT